MNSPIVNDVINMASGNLQEQAENTTGNLVNISADLPSQQDIPLAILNKASYIQYDNRDTKVTQKFLDDYNIGYKVIEDLTEGEYITAINEEQQKIVLAFRGTDPTLLNIYDTIADLEILAGLAETPIPSYIPSRFKTGETIYKQVKEQYPNYQLYLTGYSLGGTVARYIGDKYQEKNTIVFSAGSTPLEPIIDYKLKNKPSIAKYYVTDTFDIISNTSKFIEKNINIIKTKEKNKKYFTGSHSLDNYIQPIKEKLNPIINASVLINKMYPPPKKSTKTKFISKDNLQPFRKSICEERPELCYD